MKHLRTYEEKEYQSFTQEQKKLVNRMRYALKKYWGVACGVTKNRLKSVENPNPMNPYHPKIGDPNDNRIFHIGIPSFMWKDEIENFDIKVEKFNEVTKQLGIISPYDFDTSPIILNEDEMLSLLFRLKYLGVEIETDKYNL